MMNNSLPLFHLRRIGPAATKPGVVDIMDFSKVTSLIGRNQTQVDFFLDSSLPASSLYISRLHGRVVRQGGNLHRLFDDSLNGVFINNTKISGSVVLQEGDIVTFGHPHGVRLAAGVWKRQPDSEYQFIFERCSCKGLEQMRKAPVLEDRVNIEIDGNKATEMKTTLVDKSIMTTKSEVMVAPTAVHPKSTILPHTASSGGKVISCPVEDTGLLNTRPESSADDRPQRHMTDVFHSLNVNKLSADQSCMEETFLTELASADMSIQESPLTMNFVDSSASDKLNLTSDKQSTPLPVSEGPPSQTNETLSPDIQTDTNFMLKHFSTETADGELIPSKIISVIALDNKSENRQSTTKEKERPQIESLNKEVHTATVCKETSSVPEICGNSVSENLLVDCPRATESLVLTGSSFSSVVDSMTHSTFTSNDISTASLTAMPQKTDPTSSIAAEIVRGVCEDFSDMEDESSESLPSLNTLSSKCIVDAFDNHEKAQKEKKPPENISFINEATTSGQHTKHLEQNQCSFHCKSPEELSLRSPVSKMTTGEEKESNFCHGNTMVNLKEKTETEFMAVGPTINGEEKKEAVVYSQEKRKDQREFMQAVHVPFSSEANNDSISGKNLKEIGVKETCFDNADQGSVKAPESEAKGLRDLLQGNAISSFVNENRATDFDDCINSEGSVVRKFVESCEIPRNEEEAETTCRLFSTDAKSHKEKQCDGQPTITTANSKADSVTGNLKTNGKREQDEYMYKQVAEAADKVANEGKRMSSSLKDHSAEKMLTHATDAEACIIPQHAQVEMMSEDVITNEECERNRNGLPTKSEMTKSSLETKSCDIKPVIPVIEIGSDDENSRDITTCIIVSSDSEDVNQGNDIMLIGSDEGDIGDKKEERQSNIATHGEKHAEATLSKFRCQNPNDTPDNINITESIASVHQDLSSTTYSKTCLDVLTIQFNEDEVSLSVENHPHPATGEHITSFEPDNMIMVEARDTSKYTTPTTELETHETVRQNWQNIITMTEEEESHYCPYNEDNEFDTNYDEDLPSEGPAELIQRKECVPGSSENNNKSKVDSITDKEWTEKVVTVSQVNIMEKELPEGSTTEKKQLNVMTSIEKEMVPMVLNQDGSAERELPEMVLNQDDSTERELPEMVLNQDDSTERELPVMVLTQNGNVEKELPEMALNQDDSTERELPEMVLSQDDSTERELPGMVLNQDDSTEKGLPVLVLNQGDSTEKELPGMVLNQDDCTERELSGTVLNQDRSVEKDLPGMALNQYDSTESELPGTVLNQDGSVEKDLPEIVLNQDDSTERELPGTVLNQDGSVEKELPEMVLNQDGGVEMDLPGMALNQDGSVEKDLPVMVLNQDGSVEKDLPGMVLNQYDSTERELPGTVLNQDGSVEKDLPGMVLNQYDSTERELPVTVLNQDGSVEKDLSEMVLNQDGSVEKELPEMVLNQDDSTERELPEMVLNKDDSSERELPEMVLNKDDSTEKELPEMVLNKDDSRERELPEMVLNKDDSRERELPEKVLNKDDSRERELPEMALNQDDSTEKELPEMVLNKDDSTEKELPKKESDQPENASMEIVFNQCVNSSKNKLLEDMIVESTENVSSYVNVLPDVTLDHVNDIKNEQANDIVEHGAECSENKQDTRVATDEIVSSMETGWPEVAINQVVTRMENEPSEVGIIHVVNEESEVEINQEVEATETEMSEIAVNQNVTAMGNELSEVAINKVANRRVNELSSSEVAINQFPIIMAKELSKVYVNQDDNRAESELPNVGISQIIVSVGSDHPKETGFSESNGAATLVHRANGEDGQNPNKESAVTRSLQIQCPTSQNPDCGISFSDDNITGITPCDEDRFNNPIMDTNAVSEDEPRPIDRIPEETHCDNVSNIADIDTTKPERHLDTRNVRDNLDDVIATDLVMKLERDVLKHDQGIASKTEITEGGSKVVDIVMKINESNITSSDMLVSSEEKPVTGSKDSCTRINATGFVGKESEDSATISSEEESEDSATISSKEESEDSATISSKEESEDSATISSKEESEDSATISCKEESEDSATISSKEESEDSATISSKEESEDSATISPKEENEDSATISSKEDSLETDVSTRKYTNYMHSNEDRDKNCSLYGINSAALKDKMSSVSVTNERFGNTDFLEDSFQRVASALPDTSNTSESERAPESVTLTDQTKTTPEMSGAQGISQTDKDLKRGDDLSTEQKTFYSEKPEMSTCEANFLSNETSDAFSYCDKGQKVTDMDEINFSTEKSKEMFFRSLGLKKETRILDSEKHLHPVMPLNQVQTQPFSSTPVEKESGQVDCNLDVSFVSPINMEEENLCEAVNKNRVTIINKKNAMESDAFTDEDLKSGSVPINSMGEMNTEGNALTVARPASGLGVHQFVCAVRSLTCNVNELSAALPSVVHVPVNNSPSTLSEQSAAGATNDVVKADNIIVEEEGSRKYSQESVEMESANNVEVSTFMSSLGVHSVVNLNVLEGTEVVRGQSSRAALKLKAQGESDETCSHFAITRSGDTTAETSIDDSSHDTVAHAVKQDCVLKSVENEGSNPRETDTCKSPVDECGTNVNETVYDPVRSIDIETTSCISTISSAENHSTRMPCNNPSYNVLESDHLTVKESSDSFAVGVQYQEDGNSSEVATTLADHVDLTQQNCAHLSSSEEHITGILETVINSSEKVRNAVIIPQECTNLGDPPLLLNEVPSSILDGTSQNHLQISNERSLSDADCTIKLTHMASDCDVSKNNINTEDSSAVKNAFDSLKWTSRDVEVTDNPEERVNNLCIVPNAPEVHVGTSQSSLVSNSNLELGSDLCMSSPEESLPQKENSTNALLSNDSPSDADALLNHEPAQPESSDCLQEDANNRNSNEQNKTPPFVQENCVLLEKKEFVQKVQAEIVNTNDRKAHTLEIKKTVSGLTENTFAQMVAENEEFHVQGNSSRHHDDTSMRRAEKEGGAGKRNEEDNLSDGFKQVFFENLGLHSLQVNSSATASTEENVVGTANWTNDFPTELLSTNNAEMKSQTAVTCRKSSPENVSFHEQVIEDQNKNRYGKECFPKSTTSDHTHVDIQSQTDLIDGSVDILCTENDSELHDDENLVTSSEPPNENGYDEFTFKHPVLPLSGSVDVEDKNKSGSSASDAVFDNVEASPISSSQLSDFKEEEDLHLVWSQAESSSCDKSSSEVDSFDGAVEAEDLSQDNEGESNEKNVLSEFEEENLENPGRKGESSILITPLDPDLLHYTIKDDTCGGQQETGKRDAEMNGDTIDNLTTSDVPLVHETLADEDHNFQQSVSETVTNLISDIHDVDANQYDGQTSPDHYGAIQNDSATCSSISFSKADTALYQHPNNVHKHFKSPEITNVKDSSTPFAESEVKVLESLVPPSDNSPEFVPLTTGPNKNKRKSKEHKDHPMHPIKKCKLHSDKSAPLCSADCSITDKISDTSESQTNCELLHKNEKTVLDEHEKKIIHSNDEAVESMHTDARNFQVEERLTEEITDKNSPMLSPSVLKELTDDNVDQNDKIIDLESNSNFSVGTDKDSPAEKHKRFWEDGISSVTHKEALGIPETSSLRAEADHTSEELRWDEEKIKEYIDSFPGADNDQSKQGHDVVPSTLQITSATEEDGHFKGAGVGLDQVDLVPGNVDFQDHSCTHNTQDEVKSLLLSRQQDTGQEKDSNKASMGATRTENTNPCSRDSRKRSLNTTSDSEYDNANHSSRDKKPRVCSEDTQQETTEDGNGQKVDSTISSSLESSHNCSGSVLSVPFTKESDLIDRGKENKSSPMRDDENGMQATLLASPSAHDNVNIVGLELPEGSDCVSLEACCSHTLVNIPVVKSPASVGETSELLGVSDNRKERRKKLQEAVLNELVQLNNTIKQTLSLNNPNVDDAICALEDLDALPINAALIQKCPAILETVRKCQKYRYSEEVCKLARRIYSRFRALVNCT